ncbi:MULTISPECIES: hypothetical protein [Veillonella]|jgi:hypothetical protein|uniref:hypothetical protein n=1 Tax=Veillonella TaxID=29465 RepID=UPI0024918579|nr:MULTISPECIES: hypothetical protein [Veillonella]MDU5940849.1 hypothetical protein [Veillonella sp.]
MDNLKVLSLFKTKDYTECFPNISTLGKKVDFFLECSSYDLIIPVKSKVDNKLDIFEEAVLKLISYKTTTSVEMSDILCLPLDLINFITIRLQEMNFLKENGRDLTDLGKDYLHIRKNNSNDLNIQYTHAKLFVLNQTGEILPYIQIGESLFDLVDKKEKSLLTIEYGTIGHPIKVKGKIIRQGEVYKKSGMLQSSVVREALDRYNRLVQKNINYDSIIYEKDWVIDNSLSDNVYIHMQAVVQNGNVDEILVSDGFVVNIDFINDYLKREHPKFISQVKERATRNIILDNENIDGENKKNILHNKYQSLSKILLTLQSYSDLYTFIENETFINKDENQALQARQKQFLLNCYSAFEWSLYYYDKKYQINNNIRSIIENQTSPQNAKTLLHLSKKIGVMNPNRYEDLFYSLDMGKIKRMFRTTTPELRVALCLAIIISAYNGYDEFKELINKKSDLFRILNDLFKEHGDLAHQTITTEINKKRNKEIYELLIDFVRILQPDYIWGEDNSLKVIDNLSSASQEKLNAEVSLSKKLGYLYYYNLMPESIKAEWVLISPDKVNYPDVAIYSDILYRIMQDTLYYLLREIKKTKKLTKSDILLKLKEKGINSNCFNKVKDKFIQDILMNKNGTLGANAMVYLYYQREVFMDRLIELGFIQIIEELVKIRKHGNNVALTINVRELNRIRDTMFNIVKMIGVN